MIANKLERPRRDYRDCILTVMHTQLVLFTHISASFAEYKECAKHTLLTPKLASHPGVQGEAFRGRGEGNERLVHTVLGMRLISMISRENWIFQ